MKSKKWVWLIPVLILVVLLILYLVIVLVLPRNLGPIEPFRNLGDLFNRSDGTTPNKPAYYQKLYDCSTGELARPGGLIQPALGCDDWSLDRYERPFNAAAQDRFYPDLDIQYALLGRDADWYYLRLALFGTPTGGGVLTGTYAMELDLDADGRGDLLVQVTAPGKGAGKTWSTAGVQIWEDSNEDVGAADPNAPDTGVSFDGYDRLLFDGGGLVNANAAWARAFHSTPASIELAFPAAYLGDALSFKWRVWSSHGDYPPASFELNDTFAHQQAGDPYSSSETFPIREIFAIDNTCIKVWGADPDPSDPEVCFGDPEYQHCCLLKLFPCRIPRDLPGDDPCVLPFKVWFESIWKPAHPGEPIPPQGELWAEYNEYLLMPECPPEDGPTHVTLEMPSWTPTPILTLTVTPTLTVTVTLTPTITPTRPLACGEWLTESACTAAGGTWVPEYQSPTGGQSIPAHCSCP